MVIKRKEDKGVLDIDIENFEKVLKKKGFKVEILKNTEATTSQIKSFFQKKESQKKCLTLFYYCGFGKFKNGEQYIYGSDDRFKKKSKISFFNLQKDFPRNQHFLMIFDLFGKNW